MKLRRFEARKLFLLFAFSLFSVRIFGMTALATILPYIQIGLSLAVSAAVLLQQSSSGVGGAFGGGDSFSSAYHTRRGFEKFLFNATIILAILFAASGIVAAMI